MAGSGVAESSQSCMVPGPTSPRPMHQPGPASRSETARGLQTPKPHPARRSPGTGAMPAPCTTADRPFPLPPASPLPSSRSAQPPGHGRRAPAGAVPDPVVGVDVEQVREGRALGRSVVRRLSSDRGLRWRSAVQGLAAGAQQQLQGAGLAGGQLPGDGGGQPRRRRGALQGVWGWWGLALRWNRVSGAFGAQPLPGQQRQERHCQLQPWGPHRARCKAPARRGSGQQPVVRRRKQCSSHSMRSRWTLTCRDAGRAALAAAYIPRGVPALRWLFAHPQAAEHGPSFGVSCPNTLTTSVFKASFCWNLFPARASRGLHLLRAGPRPYVCNLRTISPVIHFEQVHIPQTSGAPAQGNGRECLRPMPRSSGDEDIADGDLSRLRVMSPDHMR